MNFGGSAGRTTNLSSAVKVTELDMTEINGHCMVCLYSMDAEGICVGISEMCIRMESRLMDENLVVFFFFNFPYGMSI
jgi:hypothetical protein